MSDSKARSSEALEIRTLGDPVLKRKAKPIKRITARVKKLLDAMVATMREAEGVGLAAPQVGVSERIIVVDVGDGLVELINPEILQATGEQTAFEGCLSIPGKLAEVTRADAIRVSGLNRDGRKVWIDAEGFFARALQHEVHHLDGILMLDVAKRVIDLPPESQLRLVLMGTPSFAVPVLETMLENNYRLVGVVTAPDRAAGRGMVSRAPALKRAAENYGIEVLQPEKVGSAEFLETLRSLRPDVLITAAYGQILPPEVLAIPRIAALNIHASLLPRWRGAAPIQRAIEAGDRETGITYQYMAEALDTGDILLQRSIPIGPDDHAGVIHDRLAALAAEMLPEVLKRIAEGEAPRVPQAEEQATYAHKLRREEERIDWQSDAGAISRKVQAFAPRPGMHTLWQEKPLKILAASVVVDSSGDEDVQGGSPDGDRGGNSGGKPGEVVAQDGTSFIVACGKGLLRVTKVQLAGRRVMTVGEFLNGNDFRVGEVLT